MGRELSCFVDGNNVSRHLLCSICHGVLEAPVQTACEHLFCEEELVEWMCHGNRCPVCAAELVAEEVVRAPRAIVGLIEDLECHCAYAIHGCPWTGDSAAARRHAPSCEFAPREALVETLEAATRALDEAKRRNAAQERELARGARRVRELEASLAEAKDDRDARDDELEHLRRRVRFLERALEDGQADDGGLAGRWTSAPVEAPPRGRRARSDVGRIHSLRESLETLRVHPRDDGAVR